MSDKAEVVENEEEPVQDEKEVTDVLTETLTEMRAEPEETGADDTPVVSDEAEPESPEEGVEEDGDDDFEKSLSERGQARFRELSERAKKAEEEAAQVREQGMELYKIMADSGVTPDDLTTYFDYYKNLRQGDKTKAAEQWAMMEQAHSQFTGQAVGNADPLNNHPDLQKAVEEFEITEAVARETATLRDYSQRMQQNEQRQAEFQAQYGEQQRQQQEAAGYAQKAAQDLDTWSAEMKAKDPLFEQKEALLLERAQDAFPTIHPAHWPEFIAREYEYISKAMPTQATAATANTPNPIRPGASAKAVTPEPKNIGDALTNALREMRD